MPKIHFGRLREKVKSGDLAAQDVLWWLRTKRNVSKKFTGWLRRFDPSRHKERAAQNGK